MSQSFVSITELRQDATNIINELKDTWDQIVLVNNKPKAVLVDFDEYEQLSNWKVMLYSYPYDLLSEEDKELVEETKKLPRSEFSNL